MKGRLLILLIGAVSLALMLALVYPNPIHTY